MLNGWCQKRETEIQKGSFFVVVVGLHPTSVTTRGGTVGNTLQQPRPPCCWWLYLPSDHSHYDQCLHPWCLGWTTSLDNDAVGTYPPPVVVGGDDMPGGGWRVKYDLPSHSYLRWECECVWRRIINITTKGGI